MRSIVGVVGERERSYPIAASDIRRWALAVWYPEVPPPEYWDEEHADTVALGGLVAPDEFNPMAWIAQDPRPQPVPEGGNLPKMNAFEAGLGVTPPSFKATLQVEINARYGEVGMRPGDVIECATAISDYREREGRMGLQVYTTLTEEFTNQRGEWVKSVDTVYMRY